MKTFFFGKHLRLCPWSLASSIPVFGLKSVSPRKGCPWPWPRIFLCPLALASSLVSSTPPLLIPGCLKPTNSSNLHLLDGIAPPEIRREAASKQECLRQVCDPRHMLFNNYKPAPPRLKSRKSFLHCVDPLEGKIKTWRKEAWERKLEELPSSNHLNQIFHYTRWITPKRVTSWRGPSPRHCARATQLLWKKCRSGGEPLATLCPIRPAQDLNLRPPDPEMNALPLDQLDQTQ